MRLLAFGCALMLSVGLVAGCGGDDSSGGSSFDDQDFVDETGSSALTIDAVDNNFRPQWVEISAGTTVTFENRGRNVHNVLPAEDDAFAPIEAGDFNPDDTGEITFDAGDYPYYCSLHGTPTSGMNGGIRVVSE
jgi:plastocyanin